MDINVFTYQGRGEDFRSVFPVFLASDSIEMGFSWKF